MRTESSAPLRVLFVATSGGEGGIERYSVSLAAALRARGVSLTYACRPGGFLAAHCKAVGIPTVAWEVRNSGDITAALSLAGIIRAARSDIVHVHSRRDYVPAVIGARLALRPRVVLHAHLIRPLGEPPHLAGRFFQRGAARVIAVSEAVRARLLREHGFPRAFVALLPNGVDAAAFGVADGAAQRRAWGVPPDAAVVGMMGRLDAKGQGALLAVAPTLLASVPDCRFVLVGPGDGERLRAQARELGIADRVVLTGATEDVPAAMAAFDVLAHLPDDESFGLVAAEAMAACLPVVATDVGGCREVVCDGVTGRLVPQNDAPALLSALSSLFDGPSGAMLRRRFGAAGRQRVCDEFAFNRQVERLHLLYREL